MCDPTRLTPDTRLADLLREYPFLKEELPRICGKFRLLHTPLAKRMVQQATIADMSERSGMERGMLIHSIMRLIAERC